MHTHVSALDAIVVLLYLVLIGAALSLLAGRLASSESEQAQAAGAGLAAIL